MVDQRLEPLGIAPHVTSRVPRRVEECEIRIGQMLELERAQQHLYDAAPGRRLSPQCAVPMTSVHIRNRFQSTSMPAPPTRPASSSPPPPSPSRSNRC